MMLLPLSFWYFFGKDKTPKAKEEFSYQEIVEFKQKLTTRWLLGDREGYWGSSQMKCSDIPVRASEVNQDFLKCNPLYLKCIFKGEVEGISSSIKTKHNSFSADISSLKLDSKGRLKLKFTIEETQQKVYVSLKDTCHKKKLPENIYSAGVSEENGELWDNFGREILIDKFYVTKWDYQQWKNKNFSLHSIKDLSPKLDLSLKQQKKYCMEQGGTLLQAHVFDASAFYPSKIKGHYMFKSRYPWGKSSRLPEKKDLCQKMYTLECRKKERKPFETISVSWMGLTHILGGELEVFDNIFNPKRNLKVSSKYLERQSHWHSNLKRAFWDGEELGESHFQPRLDFDVKGVAFRCMYLN